MNVGGAPAKALGLRQLALRGSAVEVGGFALTQGLRLAGNLILTRLLFPEAFGLSALVTVFLIGLTLLSDAGLLPSVVQNPRGDERRFLDTVWTIQVIRGFALWLLAGALAWPAALLFREPELVALLPVGGASAAILGLCSTSLLSLRRHLRLVPLAMVEVVAKALSLIVMVTWALVSPTVWALIAGGLVDAAARTAGSHLVRIGGRDRFDWDPEAARSILHFGKWIFGSSMLWFFARQSDRLVLGRLLGVSVLGVYSSAVFITEAMDTILMRVVHGVLFPVFSRAVREGDERARQVFYAARLRLDASALPAAGLLAVLGASLIDLLYDDRYQAAGWMLQILCVRVALMSVTAPSETFLIACGRPRYGIYANAVRTVWVWIGLPLGWWLSGLEGLIWAVALSEAPVLLLLWVTLAARGTLRVRREALAPLAFATGLACGWMVTLLLRWAGVSAGV